MKLLATQMTEELYIHFFTNIHVVHLLNLYQGVCKQQQPDDDDNVVGIFISKVQLQVNIVQSTVTV